MTSNHLRAFATNVINRLHAAEATQTLDDAFPAARIDELLVAIYEVLVEIRDELKAQGGPE